MPGSTPNNTSWRARLDEAERLFESAPDRALTALRALADADDAPAAIRAQALAHLATSAARRGSTYGFRKAASLLDRADALGTRSNIARARLAHARGYLAYRRGDHDVVLTELNRAASLYPKSDRRRAQVFDTLGMFFQSDVGDVERAKAYFLLSLELKEKAAAKHGVDRERRGIAITYGNLGRLELGRERYAEAEQWLRRDLEVTLGGEAPASDEAIVRNMLVLALLGRGDDHLDDAARELDRALAIVESGTVTHAYLLKDLARLHLARGDLRRADRALADARALAEEHDYPEVLLAAKHVAASIATRRARRASDRHTADALAALAEARSGYEALGMHRELCAVSELRAELLDKVGRADDAARELLEVAIPTAERHLFRQRQPLARLSARLGAYAPLELYRLRTRRMLGGLSVEEHHGRVRSERARITVWTCDIRGFSSYCEETGDPMLIVDMLNRFFSALGPPILDRGGRIDKYVGDNILAYFHDARAAVDAALEAIEVVRRLNIEREHLRERQLHIGIGLATGEVVTGNVGFAGKLEHTIIGGAVNRACRLVNEAQAGEVLCDRETRDAVRGGVVARAVRGKTLRLKGLGDVAAFRLRARAAPRRRR